MVFHCLNLVIPSHLFLQMFNQSLSPQTLNPPLSPFPWPFFTKPSNPLSKTLTIFHPSRNPKPLSIRSIFQNFDPQFSRQNATDRMDLRSFAGRSKKTPGGSSSGRIEGGAEIRRQAKRNARIKSKKLAESLFYRLKNPHKTHADNFTQEELEMIGLGYDRMVRFMEKDDPNLRHPYDWYKYGEYGPYSWRGVVVGDPIRGRLSDECVTMIGEVHSHEEWEQINQFEMASDFGDRLKVMDESVGFRYFWVFVRHPKWRISDSPCQQWTLVSEVVLEAGKQRLDKWNLMGRLGNKTRSLITQCAAWMRPDIIYVKRPVYQCRFEPQDDFFKALTPFLDPTTEQDFRFELKHDDGRVELCTYFGGLCKIVKVNPKAFVDDVVKAYEKLSDENKWKCLDFLITNHPVQLLHPYTKEWKAKLEEMELGCDAPDDDDEDGNRGETQITDWIEAEDGDEDEEEEEEEKEEDEELDIEEEDLNEEENEKYWDEKFKEALSSNESMEKLVRWSAEKSTAFYKQQLRDMEEAKKGADRSEEGGDELGNRGRGAKLSEEDGDELALRGKRAKVSEQEWKVAGYGPWKRRIKKSRIPPELFLRAAVRPFTYKNLVKEIVLTRHAILEGEIGRKE